MEEITVLMPVYNGEACVGDAVRSVLEQSYGDFRLLVVDDGSTDGTAEVVHSFADGRIDYVRRPHDYVASLNYGLDHARGKYVARMDADDLMHPDRLRVQHAVMEQEERVDICGTWYTRFGEGVDAGKRLVTPHSGWVETPVLAFLERNLLCHPSVMMRRSFLEAHALRYESAYCYAEDYCLWAEAARRGAGFYVEPQSLLYYRLSAGQICRTQRPQQREASHRLRDELAEWVLTHMEGSAPFRALWQSLNALVGAERIDFDTKMELFCAVLRKNIVWFNF